MNLRSVSTVAVLAALFVPAFAQSASSDEEENLRLTLPTDEWYVPKNKITFGYRVLGSGIKANFGNLGNTAMRTIEEKVTIAKPGTTTNETIEIIARTYDNGSMRQDFQRADELLTTTPEDPAAGSAVVYGVYPGTGRYQTWTKAKNADGVVTDTQNSDQLSYQSGVTRYWAYGNASQVANDRVALSTYSASSDGATAQKEEGMNGGLELTVSRDMGTFGRRFQWSLTAGLALNNMNAKTGGTVASTLNIHTDYYQLNGPAPTGSILGGPTYVDLADHTKEGTGYETTTTIGDTPIASADSSIAGGASLQGNWKIKGAYFMMRVGPTLRTQISDRFGLSASIGLAGAYAGSRYSVVESLTLPDATEPVTESIDNASTKFLGGFYADLNVDWVANERTGIFAGVNMQNLGGYDQEVGGRTAKIDFGSAVGIRGGMSFKF